MTAVKIRQCWYMSVALQFVLIYFINKITFKIITLYMRNLLVDFNS